MNDTKRYSLVLMLKDSHRKIKTFPGILGMTTMVQFFVALSNASPSDIKRIANHE